MLINLVHSTATDFFRSRHVSTQHTPRSRCLCSKRNLPNCKNIFEVALAREFRTSMIEPPTIARNAHNNIWLGIAEENVVRI